MSSQRAQFLWIGPRLSSMEQMCLRSFLAVGYEVHLYRYGPIANVPLGVMEMDATEILPPERVFLDLEGGYTAFADQFRLHLLEKRGGWWFDTDFLALRVAPRPKGLLISSTWEFQDGQCPVNAAMWSEPGNPHITRLREECDAIVERGNVAFTEVGPYLINPYLARNGLQSAIAPWWQFCPVPWRMIHAMAFHSDREWLENRVRLAKHYLSACFGSHLRPAYIHSDTYAIHWHNDIWRRVGLDKDALYHPWSPYGRAQRAYPAESAPKT